jgi:hypothetical protein
MKHMILLGGAVALAVAGPALAKPGNGHGNGHGNAYAYGLNGPVGYGHGGCPRGLAKKANPCMPPGQAKKLAVGQRMPLGYASRYGYNQIPYALRNQYGLTRSNNYYCNNGYLYRVSPRTMVVQQVLSALLR